MIPLPPRALRRVVVGPALLFGAVTAAGSMPVWVPVAAVASRFAPGRWRPLRLLWFGFVYLVYEVIAMVALFGLWIASGFGRTIRSRPMIDAHYALMGWYGSVAMKAKKWGVSVEEAERRILRQELQEAERADAL